MERHIAVAEQLLLKFSKETKEQYERSRAEAAEELHNAFVEAINQQRPSYETTLYVLAMLKASVVEHAHRQVGLKPASEFPAKKG